MPNDLSSGNFANLCPVTVKDDEQWVDARCLHAALEVGRDFSSWIKDRIEKYGFIEGVEFSPVLGKTPSPHGGRPAIEYYLTLGMAKELAMVENNEMGRLARKYFIECEKRYKEKRLKESATLVDIAIAERLLQVAQIPPNQIAIKINNMLVKDGQRDFLEATGTILLAPKQKAILTPTEIGIELGGISSRTINKMLLAMNFQRRINKHYEATDKGAAHSVMVDQGKWHHSGAPVTQLRWYSTIIDVLQIAIDCDPIISTMAERDKQCKNKQ